MSYSKLFYWINISRVTYINIDLVQKQLVFYSKLLNMGPVSNLRAAIYKYGAGAPCHIREDPDLDSYRHCPSDPGETELHRRSCKCILTSD